MDLTHEESQQQPTPTVRDLGWINDWRGLCPEIVVTCTMKKHKVSDVDVGPPNRGMEHVVRCDICWYVYRYDSSD